ncbi:hypothetical protein HELRODRAFT_66368, partial [Helobdella robusta]|uniref:FAD-binding FR-type domain-containing protein n=1 Tax=Helobdella robusta TaxID=6412 RepID=T1FYK3_HELRO
IIWLIGNCLAFGLTFSSYVNKREYAYLFSLLGYSIAISRGAAVALNLNCALVLLPVCRKSLSFVRSCICSARAQNYFCNVSRQQLDHHILFHKIIAYAICFWTVVHIAGHTFNLERFIEATRTKNESVNYHLSSLPHNAYTTWINPIPRNNTNPIYEMMVMIPGWTGLLATVILILIASASTKSVRHKVHEIFAYNHYLFILFFAFIVVHGFGRVVKRQSNDEEHSPYLCQTVPERWGNSSECPPPTFDSDPPTTWMWVVGSLILYFLEICLKVVNRFRRVNIREITLYPMNVVEIKMTKKNFKSRPGQYVTIMCPQISYFQWHPFTLTSAPNDDYFSVHVQAVGDWTNKFLKLVQHSKEDDSVMFPNLAVDGPFGNCCENVYKYEVLLLIGAGIGVTPFASILKDICYQHMNNKEMGIVKKIKFIWLCRDQSFKWLDGMLKQLEQTMQNADKRDFIEIEIFWTSGWDVNMQQQMVETISDAVDCLTGLRSKTQFGRPNWKNIFEILASEYLTEKIGVFFCGPKVLGKILKNLCIKYSRMPHITPQFVYHKENF